MSAVIKPKRIRAPFWERVAKGAPHECWPWTGYTRPSGHGLTSHNSTPMNASRKAWILTNGPIRDGKCVNHTCDNALCCNPSHMYLGTRADNMIDLWQKTPPDERCERGRRFVLTEEQLDQLWHMRNSGGPHGLGATLKECAAHFNVHVATICRYITARRKLKLAKNREDRLSRLSR